MACVHRNAERTHARYGGVTCEDPEFGWKCSDCGVEFMETEDETAERVADEADDEALEGARAALDEEGDDAE